MYIYVYIYIHVYIYIYIYLDKQLIKAIMPLQQKNGSSEFTHRCRITDSKGQVTMDCPKKRMIEMNMDPLLVILLTRTFTNTTLIEYHYFK